MRRGFIQSGLAMGLGTPVLAALKQARLDEAARVLARAVREGQVAAAVLHVTQRETSFTRTFGKTQTEDAMFLLGSISKPITVTALMTLFDRGEFKNTNPTGLTPRGLGWSVGALAGSKGCSEKTWPHGLDGNARVGRPGDSHDLRRADLAPGARGGTTSPRSRGERHPFLTPARMSVPQNNSI